jgi:hypothetical protein
VFFVSLWFYFRKFFCPKFKVSAPYYVEQKFLKGEMIMNKRLLMLSRFLVVMALILMPCSVYSSLCLAQASSSTLVTDVPIEGDFDVPCANGGAGETVSLSGVLHVVIHTTIDDSGGFHSNLRVNAPNLTGVGQVTGDVYRAMGPGHITEITGGESLHNEFAFLDIVKLVGPGPDNNLSLRNYMHVVINANGETTVDIIKSTADCK